MMKFIPKLGFFVLITLLSSTSTILPFKTTVNASLSSHVLTHVETSAQTRDNRQLQANQLFQQGIKQLQEGEIKEAKQSFKEASSIYQEIGDFQGELKALDYLGRVHQNLKEFNEAINVLESQLALSLELGNLPLFASGLLQLQGIYLQEKDYQKSIEYGELLLQTTQDLKNNHFEGEIQKKLEILGIEMEVLALKIIVIAYQLNGDLSKALEYSQRNLSIAKELKNEPKIAEITYDIAGIYEELNNYIETINYLEKSYFLADKINDSRIKIRSLESLGIIYFSLGDFHQAQEYTEEAKTLVQEINHDSMGKKSLSESEKALLVKSELEIVNLLANINLFGFGETEKAIKDYTELLKLAKKNKIPRYEVAAKLGLGVTYGVEGKYQEAINYLEEALKIEKENTSQFDQIEDNQEALTLNILAYAYGSLGNYKKALEYAQESLSIVEQFENSKIEKASSLSTVGRTYFLMGNFKESEKYLRAAINTFENLRKGIGDKNADFFSDIYGDEYELLQQVLIAQNKHLEALEIAEQGRARAFIKLLSKRLNPNSKQETSITPPTIEQIKKIAKQQNATLVEYSIIHDPSQFLTPVKIQGKGRGQNRESELFIWVVKPTGEIAFRQVDIAKTLSNKEESLTNQLTSSYQLAAIYIAPWITATTIIILIGFIGLGIWQIELLETSAKTLQNQIKHHPSMFWLSVVLLAALSGGLIYLTLPNQERNSESSDHNYTELGEIVKYVNPPIRNSDRRQLHQLLIEPIADLLPTNPQDRVIFIPQGTLFYVPFPALQNSSGEYLIEQHTMLTAPSIQVLDSTHRLQQKLREDRSTTTQKQDILVVGNPTMPTKPDGKELYSLPTSEEEARAIAALFNTEAIINEKATEDLIVQRMETARIIHLGTHGIPDENRGFGSWVALAPSDKQEGRLTAEEILNMNLNAELVVLSACETGRGRLTGDGMVGLSRSLISAGSPSVILSLWKVASETDLPKETPTKDLMIEFYRELQQNSDKAQALRQAMLTTKEKYPEPKYWAAFTLIGEAE